MRTLLDKLESKHQRSVNHAKSQITQLESQLRSRNREIYELQNATIVVDTDRIWDLEKQIDDLQQELRVKEAQEQQQDKSTCISRSRMDMDVGHDGEDEDMFGEATVAQLSCGTPPPSRLRGSFPTPPSSSPMMMMPDPGTPSSRSSLQLDLRPETTSEPAHTGVQVSLADPELRARQAELESLQRDTSKFAATVDSYKQLLERLSQRLPELPSENSESQTSMFNGEIVERRIQNLLQTLSERTSALSELTSSISSLGFPGKDAPEMLTSLSAAFRTARLELEYLTPGEITLPLTSHSAEVVDLLLVQLRDLARRVKEGDDAVDEYHSIELNLRQQLDARVSAMDDLTANLEKAVGELQEKNTKIDELEVGNNRLKGAVDGYIRDILELERLVERMEADASEKDQTLSEQQDTAADLEARLGEATKRASELQDELEVAQACRKKHLAAVNRRSGQALALRDARVAELRGEIDRVNSALREAHERIRQLRVDNSSMEGENRSLRGMVEGMTGQLQRVVRMSEELLGSDEGLVEPSVEDSGRDKDVPSGKLLAGNLRRRGGAKRRRPDSGLCLLDEDEVDI